MFMQLDMIEKLEAEFSRPVESIMRCEDFKSNFARRLSNRYISKSPVATKQDISLKLPPNVVDSPENALERIEPCSQLSKNVTEQNGETAKLPEKKNYNPDMRKIEVNALNIEVETLKWQLSQTEANRQMHIGLLKQIVSFLSRVKEHIECQKPELGPRKETMSARLTPRSFNLADLPRSRSVVHVNKNIEYTLSPTKKISSRKISKSISNVNGYKEYSGIWGPNKMPLTPETEINQKLTEEMTRLITLANTVLSTKIPDLCTCNDANDTNLIVTKDSNYDKTNPKVKSTSSLNSIVEDNTNTFVMNAVSDSGVSPDSVKRKITEAKNKTIRDFILSPSPPNCSLENEFADVKITDKENTTKKSESSIKVQRFVEKRNEYNAANFIEDESGFSSMSSFQEIGIPIISIIPPSPCKEVGYMDDITDILDDTTKWRDDSLDIEKQAVKVFWV